MDSRPVLAATLQQLMAFCAARNTPAWLVGGAARDLALGRTPHDLDIATAADGLALARSFADATGGAFVALDDERGTGRVVLAPAAAPDGLPAARPTVDIAQFRAPTLEGDLRQRDFTINALALPLEAARGLLAAPANQRASAIQAAVIDPCGGLPDLAQRTLRLCGPTSLRDDPLRMLRAFRQGAELGLTFAPALEAALRATAPRIGTVAAERVRDELLRLLDLPAAAPWLHRLDGVGLLTAIIPELEPARTCEQPIVHFLPVLAHSLETVVCVEWLLQPFSAPPTAGPVAAPAALQTWPDLPRTLPYQATLQAHFATTSGAHSRAALFKLAALLHDNAKPQTKQTKPDGGVSFYGHQMIGADVAQEIARRLRLNRQATATVGLIVREHMRPGQLRGDADATTRAFARFLRDAGEAAPDVLLHALADHLAVRGPLLDLADWRHHLAWTAAMLALLWERPPEDRRPLINGNELMQALGIGPGPLVGTLLRELQAAHTAGEIGSRAEALAMARHLVRQMDAGDGPDSPDRADGMATGPA